MALQLYLERLGFRSIGRVLGVSNVTVLNWIRAFGEQVSELHSSEQVIYAEMDEMHTYVSQKKAINGYGKKFINFIIGDRSTQTGQKLWKEIEKQLVGTIATDYWQPYEHFIPRENHIQSKAETFTIEGYNSIFRHFLARMRRKTKCYTKSVRILELSILLLMHKRNGTLTILN